LAALEHMEEKNTGNNSFPEEKAVVKDAPGAEVSDTELGYDRRIFERSEDVTEGVSFSPAEEELPDEIGTGESGLAFHGVETVEVSKKPKVKKKIKYKVIHEKGGAVRSITFTVAYIAVVLVAAVLLGSFIITAMNDVFAFSKDDTVVPFEIKDENITVDQLASRLHEAGIIEYPFLFKLYVAMKYEEGISVQAGTYEISASFNYDKLLNVIDPPPVRTTITLTFPEGITTDEIIEIFVSNGIGSPEGFRDTIENADFEYWFLEDLQTTKDRYHRLDGYLYPDTYQFYSDSSEEQALKKMLSNFNKKFNKQYAERIKELGITVDQAVILASMIESEAVKNSDYEYVSAVFHNRLASTEFNGKLESDATIQYVLGHEYGGRHEELTAEDLLIDSPYNTRRYEGYPPGPICSPSLNSLKAAIYPNADCGFYYFVNDDEGSCLFAKTYEEHLANIKHVEEGGLAGDLVDN